MIDRLISYLKNKAKKRKQKRTFQEFGYYIQQFELENDRHIEYAQWKHPFEKPKSITDSMVNFYRRLARPGSTIIDIGAHSGDTTVPMSLAVGKKGLVIGLEPNQYVYKILEKNASLNPEYTNIVPYCFAATEEDGEFVFNYSDASFCNGGFLSEIELNNHRHNYELTVEGKNLTRFLEKHHQNDLPKLDLIKVDAEGYDKEILKTMKPILNKYRPNLMVECYKRLNREERYDLYDTIVGHGYQLYRLQNFEEKGEWLLLERENMLDEKHFEMLAIHPDKMGTIEQ